MQTHYKIILSILIALIYYLLAFIINFFFYDNLVFRLFNYLPEELINLIHPPLNSILHSFSTLFIYGIYGFFIGYLITIFIQKIVCHYSKNPNEIILKIPLVNFIAQRYGDIKWQSSVMFSSIYAMIIFFALTATSGKSEVLFTRFFQSSIQIQGVLFKNIFKLLNLTCLPGDSLCIHELTIFAISIITALLAFGCLGYSFGFLIEKYK